MLKYHCGEKANNIEIAIAGLEAINEFDELLIECYKESFISPLLFRLKPFKGRYKNNLGVAYAERIQGDAGENINKAIQNFQDVIKIWSLNNLWDWILIRRNLGGAYLRRLEGDLEDNIKIAIQYFTEALKVCFYPLQSAHLLQLMGIAYLKYSEVNLTQEKYLKLAIYFFQQSSQIVFTKKAFPLIWAQNQCYIGEAYKRLQKNTEAIQAYKESLEIYAPITPILCIETGRKLGDTAVDIHEWEIAIHGYSQAIESLEQTRNIATYNKRKEEVISGAIDLYSKIVRAYIKLDKPDKALEYIERSKTRNLIDMLNFRERYPKNANEEICNKLNQLRSDIRANLQCLEIQEINILNDLSAKNEYSKIFTKDIISARNNIYKLQKELEQFILDTINPIDPNFSLTQKVEVISFQKIKQLLFNHQTALLEWYVIEDAFFTFIITPGSSTPIVWQSTPQDLKNLEDWGNEYLNAYNKNKDEWIKTLAERLTRLASILRINEILDCEEIEKCDRLILIPHRYLHLFPLHTLPLANGEFLCEHFLKSVGYAPSCQLLQLALERGKNRKQFRRLFAIENPTRPELKPLLASKLEVNRIRQYFSPEDSILIAGAEASEVTLTQCMAQLRSAHCVHFSCHGKFELQSPLESALKLADPYRTLGKKADLTLSKIFEKLDLGQCRLVTFSACESGMTDPKSISDEYIGLPSGFLYAGTPSVVSTLWTVDPLATTLLLTKFYHKLKRLPKLEAGSVALSLNQAQNWLRTLTSQKLARIQKSQKFQLLLEQTFENQKPERMKFDDQFNAAIKRQPYPFANLYYWGCFIATGL